MIINKKSQVADTMTWIIATIIVVVILFIFILISSLLAKTKSIESFTKKLFSSDGSEEGVDWIGNKTSFAYGIDPSNKVYINKWINENEPF